MESKVKDEIYTWIFMAYLFILFYFIFIHGLFIIHLRKLSIYFILVKGNFSQILELPLFYSNHAFMISLVST